MDKNSQDVHQELAKMKAMIQEARALISTMPGIDMSPETASGLSKGAGTHQKTIITEVQKPLYV